MSFLNTIQVAVSGYFLAKEIVNYVAVKKCSERLSCAVSKDLGRNRNRFFTSKFGFNEKTTCCTFCKIECIKTTNPAVKCRVCYYFSIPLKEFTAHY